MEVTTFVSDVLTAGIPRSLHVALDGATAEQLAYRPAGESNTIAWLVWHLTRIQDRIVASLSNQDELWVTQGWHDKFGRPADSNDNGMRHDDQQVLSIQPESPELLWNYYNAVSSNAARVLATFSPADLDKPVDPANPETRVGDRLRICVLDNVSHAGQAAYLRGVIERRHVYPS